VRYKSATSSAGPTVSPEPRTKSQSGETYPPTRFTHAEPRLLRLARRLPPSVPQAGVRVLGAARAPRALMRYLSDRGVYRRLPNAEPLRWRDAFPQLGDRLTTSPFDRHYFFQDVWAAHHVAALAPGRHVDVGSRVDYVGFLTTICDVAFVDIRPLTAQLDRLESIEGSVLDMPFADRSVQSLSCLHVAEHIGLGRYGDPLDPLGTRKAAAELRRVLMPGGQLLFSLPVGRPRVCFNAHRIHDPHDVLEMFEGLRLAEFSGVGDDGIFRRDQELGELDHARYACGMFRFVRPAPDRSTDRSNASA
jgi:SAM-dependent methyltransferase